MERGKIYSEHEKILKQNIIYLKEKLNPDHIIDHLLVEDVITFDQHKAIKSETTISDKTDKLIEILRFAGPDSFPRFLKCLEKGKYGNVALHLSGSNIKEPTENEAKEFVSQRKTGLIAKSSQNEYGNESITESPLSSSNVTDCADGMGKQLQYQSNLVSTSEESKQNVQTDGTCQNEMAEGYEKIPVPEEEYDIPLFDDMTELCLRIPFKDDSLGESCQSCENQTHTELHSLPGWCPRINDSNHDRIVRTLKDGDFFIWFSRYKDAFIITLRTDKHVDGHIYVKVKTKTQGESKTYRIVTDEEFYSLVELFKNYIDKGLPMKLIQN